MTLEELNTLKREIDSLRFKAKQQTSNAETIAVCRKKPGEFEAQKLDHAAKLLMRAEYVQPTAITAVSKVAARFAADILRIAEMELLAEAREASALAAAKQAQLDAWLPPAPAEPAP